MDSACAPDAEAVLQRLRDADAAQWAPGRFAYLLALARRRTDHAGLARRRLDARLLNGALALLAQLAARNAPGSSTAGVSASGTGSARSPGPLAALVAEFNQRSGTAPGEVAVLAAVPGGAAPPAAELRAVRQHRDAWSRLRIGQQLQQSLAQAPDNPGPLNSQALVLRALQAMQEDAPDHLRALVLQVESLWWLEQAALSVDPAPARPVRRAGKAR